MDSDQTYFLDANLLMYAAGSDHPLREPCRQALTKAVDQEVSLVTDAEVLQEILHRYFSIGRPETAQTVYQSAVDLCDEVIPIAKEHTTRALELLLEHRSLKQKTVKSLHFASRNNQQELFVYFFYK